MHQGNLGPAVEAQTNALAQTTTHVGSRVPVAKPTSGTTPRQMGALGVRGAQQGKADLPAMHVSTEGQIELVQGRIQQMVGVVSEEYPKATVARHVHQGRLQVRLTLHQVIDRRQPKVDAVLLEGDGRLAEALSAAEAALAMGSEVLDSDDPLIAEIESLVTRLRSEEDAA